MMLSAHLICSYSLLLLSISCQKKESKASVISGCFRAERGLMSPYKGTYQMSDFLLLNHVMFLLQKIEQLYSNGTSQMRDFFSTCHKNKLNVPL